MRRILIPVLCLAVLGVFAANVQAGSALNLLIKDGRVNSLQDLDYESVIDFGTSGIVDAGDFLIGMWEVESMSYTPIAPPPTIGADNFTAIFLVKVKSATKSGSDWIFEFEAPTSTEWLTYAGVSISGTGTTGILYSDDKKDFGSRWTDPTAGTATNLKPALATAVGTPLWEFGFAGDSDEFWKAQTDSNVLTSVTNLQYAAALNVTNTYAAASSVILNKHQHLLTGGPFSFTGKTQLQLEGSKGSHSAGNFALPTDTDIHIAPTPEPGSLALLGLGLAAIGGVVYRRRRKA